MKARNVAIVMATAIVTAASIAACGSSGPAGSKNASAKGIPAGTTVTIGVSEPLSGVAAPPGQAELAGARYAVQVANSEAALGKGVTIKVNALDDQYSNSQAVINANSILTSSAVAMFGPIGDADGTTALAGKKILNVLTEAIAPLNSSDPDVFNLTPSYQPSFSNIGTYLKSEGIHSLAFIWDPTNPDQPGFMSGAKPVFQSDGITVTSEVPVDITQTEFTATMSKLTAANPGAIYILATPPAATIIRELRGDGYKGQIVFFFSPPSVLAAAGADANGVVQPAFFTTLSAASVPTKAFISGFQRANNSEPSNYDAEGYDAMWFIIQAIKHADSTNRASIASAANQLASTGYTGIQGKYTFTNRLANLPALVLKYGPDATPVSLAG